jgi:hypothetical protein
MMLFFSQELANEKKKCKTLEEKLDSEMSERTKLAEKIKSAKDLKKMNEISEENVQLKVKLDIVNDEFKEQMDALRKNMEHMFQENQNLKDENRSLKIMQSPESSTFASPVSAESSLALPDVKDNSEMENQNSGKRVRKNSKRRGSKALAAEERQELQTKILLLSSEAEELRSANADLEEKLGKLMANQKALESEHISAQTRSKELQSECSNVFFLTMIELLIFLAQRKAFIEAKRMP